MKHPTLHLLTCACALATMAPTAAAASFPLTFPARGTSLDAGEYFATNGHGDSYVGKGGSSWALDISVRRHDVGGWTRYADGATAPYTLAEEVGYGTPLYAAADGVVVACWRDLPDSPDPTVNTCDGGCPAGHTIGGNHLSIRTADGDHVVFYGHLAEGTIPPELCPIVDADGLIDDMSITCKAGLNGFRASTRLDAFLAPDELPVVHKGDYIGDLGHSGNSWSPHLHLQVNPFELDDEGNPCQGDSVAIDFVESWHQPLDDAHDAIPYDWSAFDEAPLPVTPETGYFLIWPDPLGARKQDLELGAGDSIDVETDVQGGVVAYRNSGGNLRLTSFSIGTGTGFPDDTGDLVAQATRTEGAVQALDLVKLPVNERDYALVIRGSNGNLKVIPYRADYASGAITRMPGSREDGPVSLLAASPSPTHSGVVVAVRDDDGKLKVIDYVAAAGTLAITRPGSSAGANKEIVDVAIATVDGNFQGVVTAEVGTFAGSVTLRSFEVTAGGDVIARDTALATSMIGDVEIAAVDGLLFPGMAAVAVAMRDNAGKLRLQTWAVANNGALSLLDDAAAGTTGALDVVAVGGRDFATGVRASGGDLLTISWATDWAGGDLRRVGTAEAGAITQVDLASFHGTPAVTSQARYKHLLAGVRTEGGDLKVLSQGANYAPWH